VVVSLARERLLDLPVARSSWMQLIPADSGSTRAPRMPAPPSML
jgi:hypothetical protein